MGFYEKFDSCTILPGGADINPAIYGAKAHRSTRFYPEIDARHIEMYKRAIKKGQPIFGICRGHQLVAALNGLPLIQDTNHMGGHPVLVKNLETGAFDSSIFTNSCHHQMVWTNNQLKGELKHTSFEVLGFTSKISTKFHGEVDDEYAHCIVEPEIIIYPEIRALTCQFHPEWMDNSEIYKDCVNYIDEIVKHYF